ncbi:MAG: DUF4248 domain-containing protein, partial [Paludibacteraceae bacterium]|nr:DUF4248 domain-containing protein [Paludibacteraceae bacterium]
PSGDSFSTASMKYKAMYKSELADRMGIKHTAMSRYMRQVENQLPHYRRTQSLLTPAQVKIVCEHFCIEL